MASVRDLVRKAPGLEMEVCEMGWQARGLFASEKAMHWVQKAPFPHCLLDKDFASAHDRAPEITCRFLTRSQTPYLPNYP